MLYSDECGVYLLPLVKSTWAPKGQTPVIREQCTYEHLSLIAAISPAGNLVYGCQEKAYDGNAIAEFLNRLTFHYRKHKLAVVWDGAKIHSAQHVKDFLAVKPGRVHFERLPAYSPELNASELLWACLKERLANRIFKNIKELKQAVYEELEKIKRNRNLVRSFFRKRDICFYS
jgi:transposase